jgi:hypothetical protein
MKHITLYSAIGLVAISLAAHAARAEDLSTVTALLASRHVHDVGALR